MKTRTLINTLQQASAVFSAILITGPRQVGKTTLLENAATIQRHYVTLDDLEERELAQNDPALFLQKHKYPVTIDEVQYAPNLFSYMKIAIDKEKKPGMFWLTGSQKFHLMKGITESLAGRVAIIDMLGFSQAETENRALTVQPFLPTQAWLENARHYAKQPKQIMDVYTNIWRGSYPKLLLEPNMSRDMFYKSYLKTYIERDVHDLIAISNELAFHKFLRATAARTGQLLNYADLARDVEIDTKTAKAWLSILETSGLVYLLYPYYSNVTKRLIKTPKLYFLDTGLCAYLTKWSTPEALEAGAMSGAILETYLLAEILKSYWHNGKEAYFYFYRDKEQTEIDLLIEQDNTLYPIEFKKTATPGYNAIKSFPVLEKLAKNIGPGAVICLRKEDVPLSREVTVIPIGYL